MTTQAPAATTVDSLSKDPSRRARFAEFWYYFSENRGAVIGLWFFVFLVVLAVFAPSSRRTPKRTDRAAILLPPFWQEGGNAAYLLGTDAVGRDILSRLMYGTRYSLFIGVIVTTIALTGGILLGVIAGYFRGWVDTLIMRLMDIILAFPSLLLALVLVAVLGPGLINAMIAIALVFSRISFALRARPS
jgi:dipeptide transport system permease protein